MKFLQFGRGSDSRPLRLSGGNRLGQEPCGKHHEVFGSALSPSLQLSRVLPGKRQEVEPETCRFYLAGGNLIAGFRGDEQFVFFSSEMRQLHRTAPNILGGFHQRKR